MILTNDLRIFPCRRYLGGQVLTNYGELKCIQCSAQYSEHGELITPHRPAKKEFNLQPVGKRI